MCSDKKSTTFVAEISIFNADDVASMEAIRNDLKYNNIYFDSRVKFCTIINPIYTGYRTVLNFGYDIRTTGIFLFDFECLNVGSKAEIVISTLIRSNNDGLGYNVGWLFYITSGAHVFGSGIVKSFIDKKDIAQMLKNSIETRKKRLENRD